MAKSKKSYAEKLKSIEWQQKKNEVFNLHGWRCKGCGNETQMLSVHHPFYRRGAEPWKYEAKELIPLCDKCHKERPAVEHKFISEILNSLSNFELCVLMSGVKAGMDRLGKSTVLQVADSFCDVDPKDEPNADGVVDSGEQKATPEATAEFFATMKRIALGEGL